jgi:hypothetical protein
MALGRRRLGIAVAALALALTALLPVPPAGADDRPLRGPFLITTERGGVYRTEVRYPHHGERVLQARAFLGPHTAPTGRILFAKYLALSGNRVTVLVGGDGAPHVLADDISHCVDELAISDDGTLATYADPAEGPDRCQAADVVHLVTIDTGARLELPAPPRSNWFGSNPQFSRDGSHVALLGRDAGAQALWLYDTATGERVRELSGYRPTDLPTEDGAIVVRRHPDGKETGRRCQLYAVPVSASEPLTCWDPALRLTLEQSDGITASPDGSTVAWIRRDHGFHIVLAPVGDVTDRRDLGPSRTGPGMPTPRWVTDRFLATQSPEEDARAVRRVGDGTPVRGPIPVFAGWTY